MSVVDDLARWLGEIATIARLGVRASSSLDTNPVPGEWTHITKIDPEEGKHLPLLYPLYLQHTSAVSIGGSKDVTNNNTLETFDLLGRSSVPLFHEPSAPHHITEETWSLSRFTAIPEVLNGDSDSLVGKLGTAIMNVRSEVAPRMVDDRVPWIPDRLRDYLADVVTGWLFERAVFEAYIIQNLDSAAARTANVGDDDLLDPKAAAEHARAAEDHLGSEVLYLEYSGTFGGEEAAAILEEVSDAIGWARIWYGGGLYSRADANTVLDAGADAVIVGNVFHEIAAEEAEFFEEALDELPGESPVDRETAREWVDDAVDVADTNGAKYLSTIPNVADPVEAAARYLAQTVVVWSELEQLAQSVEDESPTEEAVRRVVNGCDGDSLPGAAVLREVLGEEGPDFAREVALGHLDRRFGTTATTLPLSHLGPY